MTDPLENDVPDDEMGIEDLAGLCGLQPDEILEYSRLRLVSLRSSEGLMKVDVRTLHRLRRISTLRDEHGLEPPAIGLVLGLMDRLETAERELRALRERL